MRGVARYCGGDVEGALADFNAALAIWPENEVALADRARVYLAMDDLDRALRDAQRAADIEPDHETAFAIIGAAYERKGDMAAAADAYDEALEIEFFCDCGAIDFDAVEAAYDRVDAAAE